MHGDMIQSTHVLTRANRSVTEDEVLRYCEKQRKDLVTGDRATDAPDVLRQLVAYLTFTQKDL